jgi:hypothetical protein
LEKIHATLSIAGVKLFSADNDILGDPKPVFTSATFYRSTHEIFTNPKPLTAGGATDQDR